MEIGERYRKTYDRLHPEDWDVQKLSDICSIVGGGTPSTAKKEYWTGTIPWISSSDLLENDIKTINKSRFITDEAIRDSATKLCPKNSILVVSRVGVGKVAYTENPLCTSQDFTNLIDVKCNEIYLAYQLSVKMTKEANNSQGTSIKGITAKEIKEYLIPLPPLSEQQSIAEVLSDMDALISAQETLIAKKRLIKQGVMQELLTGKRRLSSFQMSWHPRRLIDIGNIFAGGTPSTFRSDFWGGDIKWLPSGKIQNCEVKFDDDDKTITVLGLTKSSARLIKPKSVLIAITGATCGNIGYIEFESAANQSVIAIEPNQFVDYLYLYYLLQFHRNYILSFQNGSAQGGLNLKIVQDLVFDFPIIEEQQAISRLLSDLDEEIQNLVLQRSKANNIKQGMMQELLTGKTRLV